MASKANVTNASIANTLLVIGIANQDPTILTARGSVIQATNSILEVQNTGQTVLFSVNAGAVVQLATNVPSLWPAAPKQGGGCAFVNSNGTVYLLTSLPDTLTWAATNKLAP
jgi:hypothetical protein